jgi:pilus assembly protein CpaF
MTRHTALASEPDGTNLVGRVADRLAAAGSDPTPAAVAAVLRAERAVLPAATTASLVSAVRDELVGAGPLQSLLTQPDVSDVLVNGPEEVWVDRGSGLVAADVRFPDEAAVRRLAQRLAASAGRRLDVAQPTVDARLADGTRLHAVLPPVSPTGTLLSLRVVRRRSFTLEDLVAAAMLTPEIAATLRSVVQSRASFLVTGGTGTGKTTVLATLLSQVHPAERIVLVEDSGELRPQHPHVVRLEARQANAEGQGAVDLQVLVRQALRMRADRLVVGEVRGAEVVELLAALNTGHDGGCGTLHASAAAQLPARVEALALAAGLPRAAAHSQLAAGVDLVVHLTRDRSGRRRLAEIGCLVQQRNGLVQVEPAVQVDPTGAMHAGPGADRLAELVSGRP